MRSKRGATAVCLLMIAVLGASPGKIASAIYRSGARTLELQRDLRAVRSRVDRAPRASSFDLKNLQRRVHDRRIDTPGDPKLQQLEIELRGLRAKADRNAGRFGIAVLPRISPRAVRAPIGKPRSLDGAPTPAAVTTARPYVGRRLVALQRNVAAIERRLEQGDTTAAARLLETARGDPATLPGVFDAAVAEEPNLVALEDQISALEEAVASR